MSAISDQSRKPPLPDLTNADNIKLTEPEKALIQNVHCQRGYKRIIVEKEFKGGYSGTRVFLVSPVKSDGATDARVVTKIGPKSELREEKKKYEEFVKRALPFTAAQVWDDYEQGDWAALNYVFAGDGILGKTPSLQEYYQNHSAEEVKTTLDGLLGKALGPEWYGQNHPLNCLFREEYGQHLPAHEKLEEVVKVIFQNMSPADGDRIKIPGVTETYPHPLKIYPGLLNRMLKGRKSLVHGDLHPRNVLVDESGKGWLIDFAKVTERHNLFDFIRLETYLRLMALAPESGAFSWNDYVQFELALNADMLGRNATPPTNSSLAKAYTVTQTIRRIARKYMGSEPDFRNEYFPALFLHCLAMLKYYSSHGAVPTQLVFITACVLAATLVNEGEPNKSTDGSADHTSRQQVESATNVADPLPPRPVGTVSRIRDLERHIRETQKLLRQYEEQARLSNSPKEQERARQEIKGFRSLLGKYKKEYDQLAGQQPKVDSKHLPVNPVTLIIEEPALPATSISPLVNAHALVIGIGKYQHIRPLAKTTVDAQDVYDLLVKAGYPPAQCTLLLDGHASKGAINDALDTLARKVKADADSTVVIFFSGHGAQRVGGFEPGEYLCPIETDWFNLRETAISNVELTTALRAIPAKRMLVCLDACHSGGVGEARNLGEKIVNGLSDSGYASLASGKGRVVMAACQPDEVSWELVGMRNGLFSHYLLEGLRSKAADPDGAVRVFDLFEYLSKTIPTHKEQHPLFKSEVDQNWAVLCWSTV